MYSFIRTEVKETVGIITLNRPEKLNAWHRAMQAEVVDALKNYEADSTVRSLIMTGAGSRGFCAGQDLAEAAALTGDDAEPWVEGIRVLYTAMRQLTKPLVAALNGVAAGSGFQAALLADVRIAHPGVRMGQTEINFGIASITGPWIMREMLGLSRTIELTLTGRLMEADECFRIGLIHTLVPREQLMLTAFDTAKALGDKPAVALRIIKQRFREVTEAGFQETMDAAVRWHREAYASGGPREASKGFLEKRKK